MTVIIVAINALRAFFLLNREEIREELIFVGIQKEGLQEFQANAIDV